jgi:hypothetical protein
MPFEIEAPGTVKPAIGIPFTRFQSLKFSRCFEEVLIDRKAHQQTKVIVCQQKYVAVLGARGHGSTPK